MRPPAQPAGGPMAAMLLVFTVGSSAAEAGWTPAGPAPLAPPFVVWAGLNALAYLLPLLGLPLVRALGATADAGGHAAARWAAFLGVFGGLLAAGCAARAAGAGALLGLPVDWLALLAPAPGVVILVGALERQAAYDRAARAARAAIDAALAEAVAARAAALRARDEAIAALAARLDGRVSPALKAVRAALTNLAREAEVGVYPDEGELAALIEALRGAEAELRALGR